MRIYQNLDGENDIISDGYKLVPLEEFNGVIYEVESQMIVKGEVNVDVGCGNAFGGKNEDEEEEGAGGGAPVEKVNDLIDHFQYEETGMDKAEFKEWLKEYGKKIVPKIPEAEQDNFKKGFQAFAKRVLTKFDEFCIYCPPNWNREDNLVFSYWKQDTDPAPHFLYILSGLKSYKVWS